MIPTEAAVEAEEAAIAADIAWRKAKARRFIDLIEDGELHPIVFKMLDNDHRILNLESQARRAQARARAAWIEASRTPTEEVPI
jgi:hypothetical protein